MTRIVALTGGIGSGKSTVARMFAELGAVVLDADAVVHELQAPGSPLLDEIAEAFGPDVIDDSGALDRAALGDVVFRDPEARAKLNGIVHPKVGVEFARRLQAARETKAPLVLLDIPLLFETRKAGGRGASAMDFEAIILVHVPPAVQVARTVARDGCDAGEAQRRIESQLPIDEKKALADHVIDNADGLEETERQVRRLWEQLVTG